MPFFCGWAGVQGVTTYVLTSPRSSATVVRPSADAPLASFIFRLSNGDYGVVVLPGELSHSPPAVFNMNHQEEIGPLSPPDGMEG